MGSHWSKVAPVGVAFLLLAGCGEANSEPAPTQDVSRSADAPTPEVGPVITGDGPVFELSDLEFPTPTDRVLRIAYDVAVGSEGPEDVNASFVTAARFLNMHARDGVDPENLDLALVVHGSAAKDLLDDPAHRELMGHDNPNLPLIHELAEAGVRIIMCGQSMTFRGLPRDGLAEPVDVALSAMTAHVLLQEEGYRLNPF